MSVSDLTTYNRCKRKLWLSRKARIRCGKRDWGPRVKYRVLRSITNLIDSKKEIRSLTDFMFKTLNEIPGDIVATEIDLRRGKLAGRIDVLRKTDEGYIIQEEKSSYPPKGKIAWEDDLLQIDAYAFLAEGSSKYSPVISGIIIYNDLRPREVTLHPEKAEEVLREVIWLLESAVLPEVEESGNKCVKCDYYPLCQILPREGGLTDTQIKSAFEMPKEIIRDQ